MTRYCITGTNRGIGLEMVRQLAARGETVYATCRNPAGADALNQIEGDVKIFELDVADDASVEAAYAAIAAETDAIDVLINNAGVLNRPEVAGEFDFDIFANVFNINSIGPVRVSQAFLPLLKQGDDPKLVNISSQLGSLTRVGARRMGDYSYNMSKAAINMFTRLFSHDHPDLTVLSMHPGHVRTDMGGQSAAVLPHESAAGLIAKIDEATLEDTNSFFVYNGEEMPW